MLNNIDLKYFDLIKNALKNLWKNDSELIKREVHEECINHRLAVYLENEFKNIIERKNLSLDVEYNKNGLNPKMYGSENKKFRPDIILHKRNSNEDNYIVIEAKKSKLSKNDKDKLTNCKNPPYNYKIALGVEYGVGKNYFSLYFYNKNGGRKKIIINKNND